MKLTHLIRGAALVALFATALPTPASAQFGLIKKQLKHKIIDAVVDSAASKVFGPAPDSAKGTTARGAATAARDPRASAAQGARAGAPSEGGPQFDDLAVEITPRSLDGLEKYLTELKAARQDPDAPTLPAHTGQNEDPLRIAQYSLMTQRVVAFCATSASSGKGGAALKALGLSSGMYKSYKPTEIAALRPRCARLTALIGEGDAQ